MKKALIKHSKFLSMVLRHDPGALGLSLDDAGWVEVERLLDACAKQRPAITREALEEIVATNEKRRFAFSEDGLRIRASQGHSIGVDLALPEKQPPEYLFHGTASHYMGSIWAQGLLRGKRDHVHLSEEQQTARQVGSRHGNVVILRVASQRMQEAGFCFYQSANGVWLTDSVPVEFLDMLSEE